MAVGLGCTTDACSAGFTLLDVLCPRSYSGSPEFYRTERGNPPNVARGAQNPSPGCAADNTAPRGPPRRVRLARSSC